MKRHVETEIPHWSERVKRKRCQTEPAPVVACWSNLFAGLVSASLPHLPLPTCLWHIVGEYAQPMPVQARIVCGALRAETDDDLVDVLDVVETWDHHGYVRSAMLAYFWCGMHGDVNDWDSKIWISGEEQVS